MYKYVCLSCLIHAVKYKTDSFQHRTFFCFSQQKMSRPVLRTIVELFSMQFQEYMENMFMQFS